MALKIDVKVAKVPYHKVYLVQIATWLVKKNSLISRKFHHHINTTTTAIIAAAATITPTPIATATTTVTTKARNWPLPSHLVQNFALYFCSAYVNRLLCFNIILPSLSRSLSNQNREGNETSAGLATQAGDVHLQPSAGFRRPRRLFARQLFLFRPSWTNELIHVSE